MSIIILINARVFCNQAPRERKEAMEKKVRLVKKEKQDLKDRKANPELPAHKEFPARLEKLAQLDQKEKLVRLDPKGLKETQAFQALKEKLGPKEKRDLLELLLTEKEVIPLQQACTSLW
jgi:hypothetical protein